MIKRYWLLMAGLLHFACMFYLCVLSLFAAPIDALREWLEDQV